MDATELRKAAADYVHAIYRERTTDPGYRLGERVWYGMDVEAAFVAGAEAALAADPTPVTADGLRAMGWTVDDAHRVAYSPWGDMDIPMVAYRKRLMVGLTADIARLDAEVDGHADDLDSIALERPATMSALCRLCEAVGVPFGTKGGE
jgi:hypothetical protein